MKLVPDTFSSTVYFHWPSKTKKPSTLFMLPDDELCMCFHVTKRKVENFLRVERPRRASQMSECFGAGTGCGWCRPFLQRLFDAAADTGTVEPDLPTAADYARQRSRYVLAGGGTPPAGATPIDPAIEPAGDDRPDTA